MSDMPGTVACRCGGRTKVVNTYSYGEGVKRQRKCSDCDRKLHTYESEGAYKVLDLRRQLNEIATRLGELAETARELAKEAKV